MLVLLSYHYHCQALTPLLCVSTLQASKSKSPPAPKLREAGEGDDGGNYKKAEIAITKEEEEVISFGGKKAKEKKV